MVCNIHRLDLTTLESYHAAALCLCLQTPSMNGTTCASAVCMQVHSCQTQNMESMRHVNMFTVFSARVQSGEGIKMCSETRLKTRFMLCADMWKELRRASASQYSYIPHPDVSLHVRDGLTISPCIAFVVLIAIRR